MKYNDGTIREAVFSRRKMKAYPFPGSEGDLCGIIVLPDAVMDDLRIEALAYCMARKVDLAMDPDFFERTLKRMTLQHCVVDVDDSLPFFGSHAEVMTLDTLLVDTLYELFRTHVQAMDPLRYLDEEDVEAFIDNLKKPGSSVASLSLFDLRTLRTFALCLVRRLQST